jgi:hypothetical protein
MAAVAAFARSDQGRLYATVCDRWGIDPGARFSDDVVAFNLRAALMAAQPVEVPSGLEADLETAGRANEAAWLAGAQG